MISKHTMNHRLKMQKINLTEKFEAERNMFEEKYKNLQDQFNSAKSLSSTHNDTIEVKIV